jgi:hypothetical protein
MKKSIVVAAGLLAVLILAGPVAAQKRTLVLSTCGPNWWCASVPAG